MSQQLVKTQESEWFNILVDDCKAIVGEAVFTSRWALVEGYWELGQRIRDDVNVKKFAAGNKTFIKELAAGVGISPRTLYYALEAYDKYPALENVPEGKNISWNKLVTKYLSETPEKTSEKDDAQMTKCPRCGFVFEPKKSY